MSRYDGQTFTTFTKKNGLASNYLTSIFQDREGVLWFGTWDGVSRYDRAGRRSGESSGMGTWTAFTTKDGLASNGVNSIIQDREGHLWFGTWGGVSRYDGKTWTSFTTKDGLASNGVNSIIQDREGHLWFGTWGGGVSQYDPSASSGQAWTTFTTKDGLASNVVRSIIQDREGHLWFGTDSGMSRYDPLRLADARSGQASTPGSAPLRTPPRTSPSTTSGPSDSGGAGQNFTTFTTIDGLADNWVFSIFQDREGHLWAGTNSGVSRYDGRTFTTFTTKDGLPSNDIRPIIQDREGNFWFGTYGGGVCRYDGRTFTTFTTKDGLAENIVWSIIQDREGVLWFGSNGGSVSRYDGKTFTIFTSQDGLPFASTLIRGFPL